MNLSDVNPHIRYARVHHAHLGNVKEDSICYDCRIFFAENAKGKVVADGVEYEISNGTAIYFPPHTKYKFSFDDDNDFKMIVLDFDLVSNYFYIKTSLGTATEKTFAPKHAIEYPLPKLLSDVLVKSMPQIQQPLTQCTKNFLVRDSFYRERSSALLKLCLIEFIRHIQKNDTYSALCEDVLDYVHNNYTNQALTNEMIADKFNYHPYHLSRIIKQETGKSLRQYIIDYRLQIAKNYLLTTQHDIEQISWMSGFSSTAYFIKIFHERMGITPKKYRRFRLHTEL